MATSLSEKNAIVTGGSRGIGAQIAYELARRGANVAVTFTSPSSEKGVDKLIASIESLKNGSKGLKIQSDLRRLEAPEQIVKATCSAFGEHIDILVNNAGCELSKLVVDITAEDFSHVFDLNLRAIVFMTKAVIPRLRAPGRIINIGSVGARAGIKELSLYCASKAAVEGFTRSTAAELGAQGHTANTINPGPVETDMLSEVPAETVNMQKQTTPLEKRLGTTDDIAQIVGFLADESSRWVTGQTISASGGWAMY